MEPGVISVKNQNIWRMRCAACARKSGLALIGLLATAPPALAVDAIFEEVFVIRGVERIDGTPITPSPYFFEVCIAGPDISASTLPSVQTPVSINFPAGSEQDMTADGEEFCLSQDYSSMADLLEDYPNGSYTVTASNIAENATDTKQVDLVFADPSAYSGITAPTHGGNVSTSDPTTVTWSFVDKGGCNTGAPETCLDFIVVFAIVDEEGLPDDDVFYELILDPTATGTSIPGGTFESDIGYTIDVENRRGGIVDETSDTLEVNVKVFKGTADINVISVTAVPEPGSGVAQLTALACMVWLYRRRMHTQSA